MSKPGKFGALAEYRQQAEPAAVPAAGEGRGRPAGKKSNPAYEPTNILLRKQTKKLARRKLEDTEAGKDLSELVEDLLSQWISASA